MTGNVDAAWRIGPYWVWFHILSIKSESPYRIGNRRGLMVWPIRGVARLEDALKYWREHQTGLVEFSFLLTR